MCGEFSPRGRPWGFGGSTALLQNHVQRENALNMRVHKGRRPHSVTKRVRCTRTLIRVLVQRIRIVEAEILKLRKELRLAAKRTREPIPERIALRLAWLRLLPTGPSRSQFTHTPSKLCVTRGLHRGREW